jgi:nucleotide-binding universal stress UspA family protein
MLPFRKVVYPVDYSEPCKAVIPYVKDMMRQFQASLALVHSYGPDALAYSELSMADIELPEEVRAAEEKRLQGFAKEMFPGEHVETFAMRGDAGTAVGDMVRSQGADLVMLATRGHGAVRRFLLGSVTTKVLHDVSAAVWTGVGSALADHVPCLPYKSILCALDFAAESEGVLKAAAALAKTYGASLSLVHVVETPPAALEIDFGPIKKELVDSAEFKLRELKGSLGVDAPHAVIEAPIAEGIRDQAVRHKADLIVAGRGHAQATFSRLWSHLYPIVRQSPCPVLSV